MYKFKYIVYYCDTCFNIYIYIEIYIYICLFKHSFLWRSIKRMDITLLKHMSRKKNWIYVRYKKTGKN